MLILVAIPNILFCASRPGHRSVEIHEAKVTASIDARLSMEMTRDEFLTAFPDAELIDEQSDTASYLIYEQSLCFICASSQAFKRNTDVFARAIVFDDNRMLAIEPAEELRR